jgi:hypothetical protein
MTERPASFKGIRISGRDLYLNLSAEEQAIAIAAVKQVTDPWERSWLPSERFIFHGIDWKAKRRKARDAAVDAVAGFRRGEQ